MEKVELYFLNYKFNIFLEEILKERFSKFWESFLTKDTEFKITDEWNIYFLANNNVNTQIDYDKKEIYHYYNSICELTELNNLIRETIVKLSTMDGIIWIHCSGFMINNKTFLAIGNKGDGKTTILLNMLSKGAKFIGNDQLPVFEHNKKICTYIWRPDIKIAMDYAIKSGLTNNKKNAENEKILYLVNNKIPYNFVDAQKMSERIKKKITLPDKEIEIQIPLKKLVPIDYLVLLDKKQIIRKYRKNNILNKIKNDQETIFAYKLKDMERYMPYWNKRIREIKINKDDKKINKNIIKKLNRQTKKIICGNRLEFNYTWKNINQILEGK